MRSLTLILAAALIACQGSIGDVAGDPPPVQPIDPTRPELGDDALLSPLGLGYVPLRRLSAREAQRTVGRALGVSIPDSLMQSYWPVDQAIDTSVPYDNNARGQLVQLVDGPQGVQEKLVDFSARVVALLDDAALDRLIPCTPAGPADVACFDAFLDSVGPLLLRRPLSAGDRSTFHPLLEQAEIDGDFRVGARLALRVMLLDLEFFYHVEGTLPTSEPSVKRLTDGELASRMAFLLWGMGPDRALLERVQSGAMADPNVVRAEATRMLADPRALSQIGLIHAMWLGYDSAYLGDDTALAEDLRQETEKLVERVLFTAPQPWSNLFTLDETYLTPRLAEHYGISGVSEEGWVTPGPERRGLLSHGTFLSVGTSPQLTSPTRRGNAVLRRLTCSEVIAPDVSFQAVMEIPPKEPGQCKDEWWNMTTRTECAGCHVQMDPVGFGLERFGPLGEYREVEPAEPGCSIEGSGRVRGFDFNGPASLGAVLVAEGLLQGCFVEHYFQYIVGRLPSAEDEPMLATLETRFAENDDFLTLVLDIVSSEAFRHRVTEEN